MTLSVAISGNRIWNDFVIIIIIIVINTGIVAVDILVMN
jgi:hypothetical protein